MPILRADRFIQRSCVTTVFLSKKVSKNGKHRFKLIVKQHDAIINGRNKRYQAVNRKDDESTTIPVSSWSLEFL
jgi:hypothetical protein